MENLKELLHQAELAELNVKFNSESFLKDADLYQKLNPTPIKGEK